VAHGGAGAAAGDSDKNEIVVRQRRRRNSGQRHLAAIPADHGVAVCTRADAQIEITNGDLILTDHEVRDLILAAIAENKQILAPANRPSGEWRDDDL
jgi:hypothetical protein